MDDVIPILHGERTFAHHHYGHGDVVVGAIDICVPKAIAEIKRMATSPLVTIFADLCRTLHIQDTGLSFVVFNQLSEYGHNMPYVFRHQSRGTATFIILPIHLDYAID